MFATVGISLVPVPTDPATQVSAILAGDYDLVLIDRSIPAETTMRLSELFRTGSSRNYTASGDAELDALFAEVSTAADDAERVALIDPILDTMGGWLPVVPLVAGALGRIVGPDVLGFPDGDPNMTSQEIFDLRQVWVRQ